MSVLVLVCDETISRENENMSIDNTEVDGVDFRHFGLTAIRIFEVAP